MQDDIRLFIIYALTREIQLKEEIPWFQRKVANWICKYVKSIDDKLAQKIERIDGNPKEICGELYAVTWRYFN